jgi:hypothetical protein
MGKKLLSEMHVTKGMAKKFASKETYKTLEKVFLRKNRIRSLNKHRG